MLDKYTRAFFTRVLTPIARGLLRAGVGPDTVTIVGTLGVTASAVAFFPRGELWWGTLVITVFVFSDTVDGIMARLSGRKSNWGAFLDSVLDRIGDAAVFGSLAVWFAAGGENIRMCALLVACLALGATVSYVKARAESLGYTAGGGIAERADRLVAVLVTTGLVGLFDLPVFVLEIVLWLLAAASAWTVVHRIRQVRRQVTRA